MTNDLLSVRGLQKTFGQVAAVKDVELSVSEAEFVAIVGRSGSGKSTVLNLLSGLEYADEGRILYKQNNITKYSEDELAIWRRKNIGLVFQSFHLISTLDALENVAFPLYPDRSVSSDERRKRALACLELVGLGDRATHRPGQLSGGQQQRVAIARALMGDPSLILADEPTGNLDSQTGEDIIGLFKNLCQSKQVALIIVTHDEKVAAAADRIIRMADGRIVS